MSDKSEDTFIGRWSRLKRAGGPDETVVAPPQPGEAETDAKVCVEDEAQQALLAANRAAAESVDIEAIGYESDISVFFKEGVPALLKQAAMRRMWRSDPIFANVDGLNDYDQDFNVIHRVLTEFKSAWQAGRGYLPKEIEPDESVESPATVQAGMEGDRKEDPVNERSASDSEADGVSRPEETEAVAGPTEIETPTETAERPDAAQLKQETRPMVSLRRRMAQFNDT